MKERTLRETKAMDRMRTGSRLVHMHARGGRNWFVMPGGAVTDEVATKIRSHPRVVASEDGLFPGLSQTWRMQSFVGSDGPDAPSILEAQLDDDKLDGPTGIAARQGQKTSSSATSQ